jgi:hypothetical protein
MYSIQGLVSKLIAFCSERKWKMKLKDWNFEKYLPAAWMKTIVAKAEKRACDENKATVFFYGESQIAPERIENFKKRKTTKEAKVVSPGAST